MVCLVAATCKLETLSTTDPTVRASLTCPLVSISFYSLQYSAKSVSISEEGRQQGFC